jgi:DNA-binding transcriptional LysR family regulator
MDAPIDLVDLNLLNAFVLVAQSASFSEVARKVGVPRSSISRQISHLEAALGVQLFNRTTRHVALSTAGAALHERVGPQLEQLRKALGSVPERDERPSGDLRLSAPPDLGATFLPAVLGGFAIRYPGVNVDVRLSSRFVDLVAEGFDAALRIAPGRLPDSSLVARRLSHMQLELYAAPAYLERRRPIRTPQDTADHDWVSFRDAPPPAPFPRPRRRARITGDDMMFVVQAVRAGLGLGALPSFLATSDLTAGRLIRVLPRLALRGGPPYSLYFVHARARNLPKKITALRDHLVEYIAKHPMYTAGPT